MTHTFFYPHEGKYIIFDTASGAVIHADELDAYICEALDPCGDRLLSLPDKCPSEIRYELARHSSTDVAFAYSKIKNYYDSGLIYSVSEKIRIRTVGDHSADEMLQSFIFSELNLQKDSVTLV